MAEFSWAAAADVGGGLLGGFNSALKYLGTVDTAKANAYVAEKNRQSANMRKRGQLTLASTIRDINNKRLMESAASEYERVTTNAIRTGEAFTRRDFEASIRGAEVQGALAAKVAASGVGGAGIQAVGRTLELQLARARELADSQEQTALYDASQARANIIPNAIRQLQQGPLKLGQDFNQAPQPPSAFAGVAGALIDGLLSKKDSLQTMLGSLAPTKSGAEPASVGQTFAVGQSTVTGTDLPAADFAFTSPVSQSSVIGFDLGPAYPAEQASVRRVDNSIRLN